MKKINWAKNPFAIKWKKKLNIIKKNRIKYLYGE